MALSIFRMTTTFASSATHFFFFIIIFFFLFPSHGSLAVADEMVNIGAIIDENSRTGKEETTAMEIAVQNFNNDTNHNNKLVLHVRHSGRDPLRAASTADDLINKQQVQAIIGMETWQEAALVAEVGNRAQVPILALATASVDASLTSTQWPFLVRMASNISLEMRCVAAVVGGYRWRRVIVIYEDDIYGTNSGTITLLSDALREVGSEIEHRLALPTVSSLSDPKAAIQGELEKLNSKQSRVFILVQLSLSCATHVFTEAKKKGLMGKESVWITTDTITSVLDSVNSSIISSMQGVLGIKTYFSETSASFRDFDGKFRQSFRSKYPEENNFEPGIYALRAYDAISTVKQAMEKSTNNSISIGNILSSDFEGLSGQIRFQDGQLSSQPSSLPAFRIVNVVGKSYNELDFWTPEFGLSENLIIKEGEGTMEVLSGPVTWPGGLQRVPRGWAMPTDAKPMKIGVPGRTSFEKFVKVERENSTHQLPLVTGFCIEVFEEAVKILSKEYDIWYDFEPFNGSYEDLVDQVYYKTFDAVVGDVTILANRTKYVEFTQPYAESGLSMIVPVRKEYQRAWMFTKPFTKEMWLATGAIAMYTMIVIWFLEHRTNPDFRGPWTDQLGTALSFTFSTFFFAHRERLYSNFTRVVMVVWLFVVLILNSSYTASLTSMLTVQRLEPTVTDIESLKRNNSTVGCDGDSFVKKYLVDVLGFKQENIKNVSSEYNYSEEFEKGNIKAAFLELPYEKVFLSKYCKGYTTTAPTYRFGGLGFVFPWGSPLATDVSKAILELSEKGKITELEKKWFSPDPKCSNSGTDINNESLSLDSFWGVFVITGGTSTIVFLLFIVHLLRKYRRNQGNISPSDESLWNQTVKLAQFFHKVQLDLPGRAPTFGQRADDGDCSSSDWESMTEYTTPGPPQTPPETEIEMPESSNV